MSIKRVCFTISEKTNNRLEKMVKELNFKKSSIADAGINMYIDKIEKALKDK